MLASLYHVWYEPYIASSLTFMILASLCLYIRLMWGKSFISTTNYIVSLVVLVYVFVFVRLQALQYSDGGTAVAIILIVFTIL